MELLPLFNDGKNIIHSQRSCHELWKLLGICSQNTCFACTCPTVLQCYYPFVETETFPHAHEVPVCHCRIFGIVRGNKNVDGCIRISCDYNKSMVVNSPQFVHKPRNIVYVLFAIMYFSVINNLRHTVMSK